MYIGVECYFLVLLISTVGKTEVNEESDMNCMADIGPLLKNEKPLINQEETHLVELKNEPSFFSTLYDGFKSGVSIAYDSVDSAKHHFHSKLSGIALEFTEKVREIIKNEFLLLILDSFTNIVQSSTAPGRCCFFL